MKINLKILPFVLFEIFVILFLLIKIKDKTKLRNIDSVAIKKADILPSEEDPNTSCYEFVANNDIHAQEPWMAKKVTYTINSDGLNNTKDYLIEKPNNIFRIVTLGDSFTYGQYVNTQDNWTEVLEKKLNANLIKIGNTCNKVEVINLGVPGYDIDCAAERYKAKGAKYNPDLIFWYIKSDDLQQIRKYFSPIKDKYVLELKKKQQYDRLIVEGTIELNKQIVEVWNSFIQQNNIDSVDYQINILQAFAQTYQKKTILFNFQNFNSLEKQKIKEVVSKNTTYFNFFDNANKYDFNSPEYTNLPHDSHLNIKGNMIVANELFNYLMENNFISCK